MSDFDFAFDSDSIKTEKPMLSPGFYAGVVTSSSISRKDENGDEQPTICVQEEIKYENRKPVKTGNFILKGAFNWTVTLTSETAKKVLIQDEPKVFGRMTLIYDQNTGKLSTNNNPIFGQLVKLFNINVVELFSAIDTSDLDQVHVPEELEHLPNMKKLHMAAEYSRRFFTLFGQMIQHQPVKAKIKRQKNFADPSILETALDLGNMNQPSCGMLKMEGSEFDYSASS